MKIRKIFSVLMILLLGVVLVSCSSDKDLRGAKEVTNKDEMNLIMEEYRKNLEAEEMDFSAEQGDFLHSIISVSLAGEGKKQIGNGKIDTSLVVKHNPENKLKDVYYRFDSLVDLDIAPLKLSFKTNRHIIADKYYIEDTSLLSKEKSIKGNVVYTDNDYSLGLDISSSIDFDEGYDMIYSILFDKTNNFDVYEYLKIYNKGDNVIFKLEMDATKLQEIIANQENVFGTFAINKGLVELTLIFTPKGLEKASIKIETDVSNDGDKMAFLFNFDMFIAKKDTLKKADYSDHVASDDKTPSQAMGESKFGDIL